MQAPVELFRSLANILYQEIPRSIAQIASPVELCNVKLRYFDTSAPAFYYDACPMRTTFRNELLITKGRDALFYVWDEGVDKGVKNFDVPAADSPARAICKQIQRWRCDDETIGEGRDLLRQFVCGLCRRLNQLPWHTFATVSDDFVIYPQNGTDSGIDCYEDIIESIPIEKIRLLRERELLGPGRSYCSRRVGSTPEQWTDALKYGANRLHPLDDWKH